MKEIDTSQYHFPLHLETIMFVTLKFCQTYKISFSIMNYPYYSCVEFKLL